MISWSLDYICSSNWFFIAYLLFSLWLRSIYKFFNRFLASYSWSISSCFSALSFSRFSWELVPASFWDGETNMSLASLRFDCMDCISFSFSSFRTLCFFFNCFHLGSRSAYLASISAHLVLTWASWSWASCRSPYNCVYLTAYCSITLIFSSFLIPCSFSNSANWSPDKVKSRNFLLSSLISSVY